jgi:hypothetical protein
MTAVAPSGPRALPSGSRAGDSSRRLLGVFALQLGGLILLQKLAIPAGGSPVSVLIPLLYAGLALGALSGLRVSLLRAAAFGGFLLVTLLSQLLVAQYFSYTSYLLLLVLYFPLAFVWPMPEAQYRRVLGIFQNLMILGAVMVFVQLGWQLAFGQGNTLSIEPFLPQRLLLPGYLYNVPIHFGAAFVRPNGFFFLEPSFVSMFLAAALIIELTDFGRPLRIGLYAGALIGCLGATGWVMVLVAAPFMLRRLSPRMLLICLALTIAVSSVALVSGGADLVARRLDEFNHDNSSASERLVAPFHELGGLLLDPDRLLTGTGAGNAVTLHSSTWPITKLLSEYGAVTTMAYFLLLVGAIWRAPNRALAWSLFVIVNFTGGYLLNPVAVGLVIVLLGLPRPVARRARSGARVGRGWGRSTPQPAASSAQAPTM